MSLKYCSSRKQDGERSEYSNNISKDYSNTTPTVHYNKGIKQISSGSAICI